LIEILYFSVDENSLQECTERIETSTTPIYFLTPRTLQMLSEKPFCLGFVKVHVPVLVVASKS